MNDDTDKPPDFAHTTEQSFAAFAARLVELEEWGWVSADPSVDDDTRDAVFRRVFPDGQHDTAWNDYHWVRSQHDRLAAEEFDLGQ
jgi:hypothetical protein